MVQIEKRKKKGRPSKADLAARRSSVDPTVSDSAAAKSLEQRRSLRRRSFRYNIIDYDEDYLDDDDMEMFVAERRRVEADVEKMKHDDDVEEEGDDVEEEEEDRDEERREKKVKLVMKLDGSEKKKRRRVKRGVDSVTRPGRKGRVRKGVDSEEDDDVEEEREVKKRRINSRLDADEVEDVKVEDDDEDEDDDDDDEVDDDVENGVDEGKGVGKRGGDYDEEEDDDVPGTPRKDRDDQSPTPLPDKKQLELILDKLQKKDTYGVYAEPVDPEELPDYHEVIEHPMDFSTVRKKLADGAYSILEEFESDVFLISANAMQYNAPDTVYHKQARTIKELAERKFQRMRIKIERLEREPKSEPKSEPKFEPKSEQKDRSCSVVKKQTKKPFYCSTQEPVAVASDFSSGATLATVDVHNSCGADHASNVERTSNNDGPIDGISSLADNNIEKAEDPQSGRGVLPKFGRRSLVVDENRRATYNISNQPMDKPESIFTIFEGDKKQLIPVGLSGEYSYARSLARFAANLGPKAWGLASKRIEQVLPPGFKYGRGWIGEYEPLQTALLVVEPQKNPFVSKLHNASLSTHHTHLEGQTLARSIQPNQHPSDGKFAAMFSSAGAKPITPPLAAPQQHIPHPRSSGGPENMMLKRVESNCLPAKNLKNIATVEQQSRMSRDSMCPDNTGRKRVEQSSPLMTNQNEDSVPRLQLPHAPGFSGRRAEHINGRRTESHSPSVTNHTTDAVSQPPLHMEMPASRPAESSAPLSKQFLQTLPFKQPDVNGGPHGGSANGRVMNSFVDINHVTTSSGPTSMQAVRGVAAFPQKEDQGLSDPVLVMKMMTERAQKQQNGSVNPHSSSQARPSAPSPRGDGGGNAAAAAASAWMSVGAVGFRPHVQNPSVTKSQISSDSLSNGTRVFYPQAMQSRVEYPASAMMQYQQENKGMPFQAFAPRPKKVGSDAPVHNRPMSFPQLAANDLSRFQVQTPWRGLSPHTQPKQKQDTLPPDLNVAFQSSVDSQQPDLALQL